MKPPAYRSFGRDELWLQTACAAWLVAVGSRHVERLILPDEGRLAPDPFPGPAGSLGLLTTRERVYSAWDLGVLLGLVPQDQAYVLVRLQGIPLALRTGACIGVSPLPRHARLPRQVWSARQQAFSGVFAIDANRLSNSLAHVGLALELERLFTPEELLHADAVCVAASMIQLEEQEARP